MKLTKTNLRRIILEEMTRLLSEDTEGEETYHYGEDEGEDDYRLKHDHMGKSHRAALEDDMAYDEDHEDRHEKGTHFSEGELEEVVSVNDTDDNAPGWNSMSAADTQAEEEKEAGQLNIGENREHLSRGALYRQRYYGRY